MHPLISLAVGCLPFLSLIDECSRRHVCKVSCILLIVCHKSTSLAETSQYCLADFCSPSQVAYFVNSGSEANDMAILMARLYSGNHDLVALRNGYHGISEGLLGVLGHSTWKYNVPSVSA